MTPGPVPPAPLMRRAMRVPAASGCPGADEASEPDGAAQWDEWYREDSERLALAEQLRESKRDLARRAFLAGWLARDDAERRKAAGGLTKLTEELGLYDEGRER